MGRPRAQGATLIEYGTDEQKQSYLPRILAGECHFSIGYSEPNAGTDLASLTTSAVKDGKVVDEEPLLVDLHARIRDVRVGPDGYVYLLTDEEAAELWRLVPK